MFSAGNEEKCQEKTAAKVAFFEEITHANQALAAENGECIMQTNVLVVYTLKYKNETGLNQFCVSTLAIGHKSITWVEAPPIC